MRSETKYIHTVHANSVLPLCTEMSAQFSRIYREKKGTKINFVIYFLFLSSANCFFFVNHPCSANARRAHIHPAHIKYNEKRAKEREKERKKSSTFIYCLWRFYQFLFCTHIVAIECVFFPNKVRA